MLKTHFVRSFIYDPECIQYGHSQWDPDHKVLVFVIKLSSRVCGHQGIGVSSEDSIISNMQ